MEKLWSIAEAYKGEGFLQACESLDAVFKLQGEQISKDKISDVIKVALDGKNFYVKRYFKPRSKKSGWFKRSRVRAEWENLQFFASLGIPTPLLAAWGEQDQNGLFQGALITEELKDTQDLATLNNGGSALFDDASWFRHTAQKVAQYTRLMHDQNFMHLDLKWRNVLVEAGDRPEVFFFDCPSGKRLSALFFRRGRIKDLACLDKIGRKRLRRTQRLAFYKYYAGCDKLSPQDKVMVRKIDRFSAYLEGEGTEAGWRIF
ncbi:MAG: lipopolysaccharide kinase InaA family protein [Pseudomonadales bacterium]